MNPFAIDEIIFALMLHLDMSALFVMGRVDRRTRRIFLNDYLWMKLVQRDYPSIDEYKPESITYRKQYRDLYRSERYWRIRLEYINESQIFLCTKKQVNRRRRYLEVVERSHLEQRRTLDRVDLVRSIWNSGLELDGWDADWIAGNGQLDLLKWLLERGIRSGDRGFGIASNNGHLEVLEWMYDSGVLPTGDHATRAASGGQIHVLDWLEKHSAYTYDFGALLAGLNGHLDTLIWLKGRGVELSPYGRELVIKAGHSSIIEWLET